MSEIINWKRIRHPFNLRYLLYNQPLITYQGALLYHSFGFVYKFWILFGFSWLILKEPNFEEGREMYIEQAKLLCCPKTLNSLELEITQRDQDGRIVSGNLIDPLSKNTYPIINYIPRFVAPDNYASSFGFQWNLHNQTQHDDFSKLDASQKRFWTESQWEEDLSDQLILEACSGSGRFSRYAVEAGATVVSFDYSSAVEANFKKNGHLKNLLIVQADVFNPPFRKSYFDKVFCFGALQHTPHPKNAFLSLVSLIKPQGKIAVDIYLKSFINYYCNPVYHLRPFTRNTEHKKLYSWVKAYVDFLWPLVRVFQKVPKIGYQINRRILMVADHSNQFPDASDETLKQWAYLDTFDWFSPQYDLPQTIGTLRKWFSEAGLTAIEVQRGYNGIEGRGLMASS